MSAAVATTVCDGVVGARLSCRNGCALLLDVRHVCLGAAMPLRRARSITFKTSIVVGSRGRVVREASDCWRGGRAHRVQLLHASRYLSPPPRGRACCHIPSYGVGRFHSVYFIFGELHSRGSVIPSPTTGVWAVIAVGGPVSLPSHSLTQQPRVLHSYTSREFESLSHYTTTPMQTSNRAACVHGFD